MNKGKVTTLAAIDESFATDYVEHNGAREDIHGMKDHKKTHTSDIYSAFPDIHFTINDMIVEGDKVAVRYTIDGTHKGEFMGIPPTNKKVTVWGICIDRIAGGKFVESWVRYDTLGLMRQLGLTPSPKK